MALKREISKQDFIMLRDSLRTKLVDTKVIYSTISHGKYTEGKNRNKLKSFCSNNENKQLIKEYFSLFNKSTEAWYCLLKRVYPLDFKCSVCGKNVAYSIYDAGYDDVCSKECRNLKRKQTCLDKYGVENYTQTNESKEKHKQSCLDKYGVEYPIQSEEIRNKIKQTCLDKYGVEHYSQTNEFKQKYKQTCLDKYGVENYTQTEESKEKHKQTCLDKYGVEYYSQTNESKEKYKQTCLEKYGVENYNQLAESKERHKQTCLDKYGVEYYSQTDEFKQKYKQTCLSKYNVDNAMKIESVRTRSVESHNKKVSQIEKENNCTIQRTLLLKYGQAWLKLDIPKIVVGNNVFISNEYIPEIKKIVEEYTPSICETELYNYCCNITDCKVIANSKDVIPPREIDIYIPDKKLAIEFNGMYWHSTLRISDKNYHLSKTKECEKQGIRLIHVWEDLWNTKKSIYESIIKSALGIYDKKIYARKCECKTISSKDYTDFLNDNHIQGSINSSLKLGLFYNGELVQVAGWGKSRFKNGEYELHRMCSKLNTQVIGGFSKLIKHSNLKRFISYVDRDVYNGSGYLQTGFKIIGETPVSYFYYRHDKGRLNRISAQKFKLEKLLDDYSENLTEYANMINNKFLRIYNCGNLKVEFIKE